MTFLRLLGFCALLITAACGREPMAAPGEGGPALWRVEGHGMDGWLFGTIHVLPRGVAWQTDKIRTAMNDADRLVLESAEIQDQPRTMALFEKMGRSPGLPSLESRVPAGERRQLRDMLSEGGASAQMLSSYESWAAAMLLSAAAQQQQLHVSADQGVEPRLIEAFRDAGKPIGGLETVARQFGAFDTLPQAAQQRLLVQTVHEAQNMGALYDRILRAWLKGDMVAIAREDRGGEQPDPVVEQAVLIARNRDWARTMERIKGRPFVAVGTGHLTGSDNFILLLQAKGYKVTRLQ